MEETGSLKILAVGSIDGRFFVPDYQRGYRWTEHEVRQLLWDIRESNGSTYYLQPIVVKSRGDGSWELVDGQQRLTTLYLIFQYIRRTHLPSAGTSYQIEYETRKDSKDYLERLSSAQSEANIDFFHMFRAYTCIEEWFQGFGNAVTHEATRFYGYLFENVKVLWYQAPDNVNSSDLFTRLNVGRIPLTDAELTKALLLSHGREDEGNTDRALEMSNHWDNIERDLRVPEVWSFVAGDADGEATHISLLLDTLAGGVRRKVRLPFETFEALRPQIEADPREFWKDVVELHSLVLGWYEDRTLYHKVGYLIAVGKPFGDLVEISKGKGRSAFERALDDEIRAHLDLSSDEVVNLSYKTPNKTRDILLLMNVETIRKVVDSTERYSFRAYAAGSWSLEHIHAQNAEPLDTVEQWTAWLESHRQTLNELPGVDEIRRTHLSEQIDQALSAGVTKESFRVLEKELLAECASANDPQGDEIDSISNLTLLDCDTNSALSDSVFDVKRRHIIRRDKEGVYIPVCTRNVFLKYYTEAGSQQPHFWDEDDRQGYLLAIQKAVGTYLRSNVAHP